MVDRQEELVDMVFKQKIENNKKIKRNRRRRFRRRLFRFLFIFGIISLYVFTDVSKPKVIQINGNKIISKEEILSTADISLNSNLLYANPILINHRLKKHPFITSVSTKSSPFTRIVSITIDELNLFGYRQSDNTYMILEDGSSEVLDSSLYHFLPDLIYVEGFDDIEDQQRLVASFQDVELTVLAQVSEIHQTSVSYDDKLLEIWMNDGNRFYTSFQTVDRLNYYFDIIKSLDTNNACLVVDEMSAEVYSQPCE